MDRARRALRGFKRRFPAQFRRLFRENLEISYRGDLLQPLAELGLVTRAGQEWRSPFLVSAFRGLFIVTDTFHLQERDRVFPLSNDESFFLARKLRMRDHDVVMDVGTGSGVLALHAATRSRHVVATDINPKALAYARFNAALNGLEHKIDFCYSDVFDQLNGAGFDLIISNPPVIPTPAESGFFTHSDGGPLGLSVSKRILKDGAGHLKPKGRIQMLSISFSNEQGILLVSQFMKTLQRDSKWSVRIDDLYDPSFEPVKALTDRFKHLPDYPSWLGVLQSNECKRLHYFYLYACADSDRFNLTHRLTKRHRQRRIDEGSWEARLSRLFLAYQRRTSSTTKTAAASAGLSRAR